MGCKKRPFYVNMPHRVMRCEGYKGYHTQTGTKMNIEGMKHAYGSTERKRFHKKNFIKTSMSKAKKTRPMYKMKGGVRVKLPK